MPMASRSSCNRACGLKLDVLIESRRLYEWMLDPALHTDRKPHPMSMRDGINMGFGRRLPMILQTEAAECGMACLAMIAGYYGNRTDLAELRRRYGFSLKGVTLVDLIRVAGEMGLCRRARSGSTSKSCRC